MKICMSTKIDPSSETQGQIVGPKTKIKTGGKKFDEQKYERKIRAPGDKLFTHSLPIGQKSFLPNQERVFLRPFGTGA